MLGQRNRRRIPVVDDSTSGCTWDLPLHSPLQFPGRRFPENLECSHCCHLATKTGGCSHLPRSSIILGPWALHRPGSGGPANKAPSTCLSSRLHTGLTGTTETLGNRGKSTERAGWLDQGQTWTTCSPTGPSYLFPSRENLRSTVDRA